jgi:hypothetical protein
MLILLKKINNSNKKRNRVIITTIWFCYKKFDGVLNEKWVSILIEKIGVLIGWLGLIKIFLSANRRLRVFFLENAIVFGQSKNIKITQFSLTL